MLVAGPVDWLRLYGAKLLETIIASSWMVLLVSVPMFTAFGLVYDGGFAFPLVVIALMLPMFIIPGVIGSAVTLTLVNIFPAPTDARHPLGDRGAHRGRDRAALPVDPPRAARAPRRIPQPRRLHRGAAHADLAAAAERVGAEGDDGLPERRARLARDVPALDDGARGDRARRAAPSLALSRRLQQGAGEFAAVREGRRLDGALRRPGARAVRHAAPRAGAQGAAALLPRHDAVVAADPARGARRGLCVQHQVPPAARRGDHVLPRERGAVPEPRARRLRARVDRRAVHLPRRLARRAHTVAAALEPDARARPALGEVLGGRVAAADPRGVDRRRDELPAPGQRLHVLRLGHHDHAADVRAERARDRLRDDVPAVRDGERGADPDELRRTDLHDGLGGGDRGRGRPRSRARSTTTSPPSSPAARRIPPR